MSEIVYRWMALDHSGYCYGSHPPENLPARCNLKAFRSDDAAWGREDWQRKAIDAGFEYWRASDAHGVTGTIKHAVSLLQDLLGVEVEIEDKDAALTEFGSIISRAARAAVERKDGEA